MFWRKHSFVFNILDRKNVISLIGKKRFQSTPFAILHKKFIQKVIYAKKVRRRKKRDAELKRLIAMMEGWVVSKDQSMRQRSPWL